MVGLVRQVLDHAVNVNFPGVSTTDQCAGSQHEDRSTTLTDGYIGIFHGAFSWCWLWRHVGKVKVAFAGWMN